MSLTPLAQGQKQRKKLAGSMVQKSGKTSNTMKPIQEEGMAPLINLTLTYDNSIERIVEKMGKDTPFIKDTPVSFTKPPLAQGICNLNRISTKDRCREQDLQSRNVEDRESKRKNTRSFTGIIPLDKSKKK